MRPILDRFRLDGRVAVVTGASSGLGRSFAQALAEAGADVVLAARRVDRLNQLQQELEPLRRRVLVIETDVSNPESCERLVATATQQLGGIHVLVNNAGTAGAVPATREEPASFRRMIEVNLMGTYWMTQACGRVMRPGSSIINISSVLALTTARLPQAAYAASKSGLIGLTRDLAQQWTGRKGIRVNALAPGLFLTEMTDQYNDGYLEQTLDARVPAGRVGELWECAAGVVFLASPASSYISGVVLPIDGGMLTT